MKVLLFGGTTEGRKLAGQLAQIGAEVTVSVATEYGRELVELAPGIQVLTGRMNQEEMMALMEQPFDWVVDATHPYATQVTETIGAACKQTGRTCLRLLRQEEEVPGCTLVDSAQEAAEYLNRTEGAVLLTTGSKDISAFTATANFQERCYVRVLPTIEALEQCRELGFDSRRVIAMQGPFSAGLNEAMLRQINARWLVTKESGQAGGFQEKLTGAEAAGAQDLVIRRPTQVQGYSYEEIIKRIGGK